MTPTERLSMHKADLEHTERQIKYFAWELSERRKEARALRAKIERAEKALERERAETKRKVRLQAKFERIDADLAGA